MREDTVQKIDKLIYTWLFHGETITPNKLRKLGVNPKTAREYVEKEIPRYVGENKRARKVQPYWGYVEGLGALKLIYIQERIDNLRASIEKLFEKGVRAAREQRVFGARLIRYARIRQVADFINPLSREC